MKILAIRLRQAKRKISKLYIIVSNYKEQSNQKRYAFELNSKFDKT
jgi:SET domain-containing protein